MKHSLILNYKKVGCGTMLFPFSKFCAFFNSSTLNLLTHHQRLLNGQVS